MVSISASAVRNSSDQADAAEAVGLARELRQVAQHLARDRVGHQALHQVLLQRDLQLANIGKAENSASITVTNGTSEMVVVKVRLLAVRPSRSSRKRSRKRQRRVLPGAALAGSASERGGRSSAAMMPSRHAGIMPRSTAAPSHRRRLRRAGVAVGQPARADRARPGLGAVARAAAAGRHCSRSRCCRCACRWPGLLRNRMYTYRWLSLLVWLYFTEGVVRAASDRGAWRAAGAGRDRCCACCCSPPAPLHVRARASKAPQRMSALLEQLRARRRRRQRAHRRRPRAPGSSTGASATAARRSPWCGPAPRPKSPRW